ncbi:MFS transporter [Sulfuriroseicoccus oceanibius]|uniref:MFS transporter n=1 Tax=Sulfuriroseicoccus oceanibius TaxID=2707525 RepID=A0A7T7F1D9_9BACT|nr:MFS transporter [Sulfuriroseicoccus oceanibius]QQL44765.1 MFS transporter [Sulfuriroseicoccus oceanibius]
MEAIARNNTRRFILFRVLFNARFYYPVFAIIFLDFGITLGQFALLNAIWAATIILAEVPSGALSDLLGRKKLLVMTSSLMVMEMAVWAFAPRGNPSVLFWFLAVNRFLSGLGEASASGSDEALAYESLEDAGREDEWSNVLERTTKYQSVAFMVAMVTGGLVYDPGLVSSVAGWFGLEWEVTKDITLRLPLFLTLATGVLCWINCLGFVDSGDHDERAVPSVGDAFRQTFGAGKWILRTPFALAVIVTGAFADSVVRMFVTLGAEYYRLIQYPEFALGLIGAGMALLNLVVAPMARRMVDQRSPGYVFAVVSVLGAAGFFGVSWFVPYVGLVFMVPLFAAFTIISFSLSFYLNRVTEKKMRATVLSFKGMALNLGYGLAGVLYAALLRYLSSSRGIAAESDELFMVSTGWFGPCFVAGVVMLVVGIRVCGGRGR